jgi:hypothetical protein
VKAAPDREFRGDRGVENLRKRVDISAKKEKHNLIAFR